jgi:hypothetical protein
MHARHFHQLARHQDIRDEYVVGDGAEGGHVVLNTVVVCGCEGDEAGVCGVVVPCRVDCHVRSSGVSLSGKGGLYSCRRSQRSAKSVAIIQEEENKYKQPTYFA